MLAKYIKDKQPGTDHPRLSTSSSDSQFSNSQFSLGSSIQPDSLLAESASLLEPINSQSSERTITLSSPSQAYWSSSQTESLSEQQVMPMYNEKVEAASQTEHDFIVLDRVEYQNLLLKAANVPFDMKSEVQKLSQKCYHLFENSAQPEMNPDKMEQICQEAGAINLFSTIYVSMVTERHSSNRKKLNRSRTVVIIYMLLYGLSQRNNWFQVALARTLTEHGISEHGLASLKNVGVSAHPRTVKSASKASSDSHLKTVQDFLNDAQNKRQMIAFFIDDYHNIHTMHRTSKQQQTQTIHMATLLLKVFPNVEAIDRNTYISSNDTIPANSAKLKEVLTKSLPTLSRTYAEKMPDWITAKYFNPEFERRRLLIHDYRHSEIQDMRSMKHCKLVDCIEMPLKSYCDFLKALQYVLENGLASYLREFDVPFIGDWPAQFYMRQIVYSPTLDWPLLQNIVPFIGPLHISLNSRECVVRCFLNVFSELYSFLFGKRAKLAKKPQPWRISLLLEVMYGGWCLIRDLIMPVFTQCKSIEYLCLLNLLDNYCPLVLSIYSVVFKSNSGEQFYESVFRCWIMMMKFERRHYDKALLVAVSMHQYLKEANHPMYDRMMKALNAFDEYPVENYHSRLRARTRNCDTGSQIQLKARELDACKHELDSFKIWCEPKRNFSYSPRKIQYLKCKASEWLTMKFQKILQSPNLAVRMCETKGKKKRAVEKWKLPTLFGDELQKCSILPVGFFPGQDTQPNPNK